MTSRRLLIVACALSLGASACAMNPRPNRDVVYVVRRPPADRVEVISVRPGPNMVWVRGRWEWRGNDFVWRGGEWMRPNAGVRSWVPGKWQHDRRGWYYVEGHWR